MTVLESGKHRSRGHNPGILRRGSSAGHLLEVRLFSCARVGYWRQEAEWLLFQPWPGTKFSGGGKTLFQRNTKSGDKQHLARNLPCYIHRILRGRLTKRRATEGGHTLRAAYFMPAPPYLQYVSDTGSQSTPGTY